MGKITNEVKNSGLDIYSKKNYKIAKSTFNIGLITLPSWNINIEYYLFLNCFKDLLKKYKLWKWFVLCIEDHKDGTPHMHLLCETKKIIKVSTIMKYLKKVIVDLNCNENICGYPNGSTDIKDIDN